jgi:hypothetical protein
VPQLPKQLKLALDEARILALGDQVLVALAFRTAFEQRFADLPHRDQLIALAATVLLLLALALTMTPAARHQIVERGHPSPNLLRHVTRMVSLALLPFSLALGLTAYLATVTLLPPRTAALTAAAVTLLALTAWYGLGLLRRNTQAPLEEPDMPQPPDPPKDDKLEDRINFALTEVRVVLPGAQALLGFQAAIMFTDAFAHLSSPLKYAHLASLLDIVLTVILLMTPAAYHRIGEQGRLSPHLHRLIARMLLTAMAALALGISLELYVVAHKITQSHPLSTTIAALTLATFYTLWFACTLWARHHRAPEAR